MKKAEAEKQETVSESVTETVKQEKSAVSKHDFDTEFGKWFGDWQQVNGFIQGTLSATQWEHIVKEAYIAGVKSVEKD